MPPSITARLEVWGLPAGAAQLYADTTLFPQPTKWRDAIPWGKLAAEDLDPEEPEPDLETEPEPEAEPQSGPQPEPGRT